MKRFLTIIGLCLISLFSCFFTACDAGKIKDDLLNTDNLTALSAPSGLRISGNDLEWNPVEFAEKYTVSVDGNEYYVNDTVYGVGGLADGEHIFKVKANGDGLTYKSSPFSAELKVTLADGYQSESGYYSQFDDLTKNESFLGYGFDVINSSMFYDKVVKTSFPIFKQEELMNQRLVKVDSKRSTVEEVKSSKIEEFMEQWNVSANVDVSWGKKKIGGSVDISAKFSGGSETAKSMYYHAISIKNQKYYIVMQSDMDTYRSIISEGFEKDLYSDMSPAELFRKYGTHFITSAVMGGRIDSYYLYTSEKESSFTDISAAVSVEVRYLAGKTDVSVEGGYHQKAQSENIDIVNNLEVIGGGDFGMRSDADIGANYAEWEKSLNNHSSLMGIKDTGSLCPIWDLVDSSRDSERAAELQDYFMEYGVESYNNLLKEAGLPEIKVPTDISNIRVNDKEENEFGEYEVIAGTENAIAFDVLPEDATGYTKKVSLTSTSEYFSISEDGMYLVVSPQAPHNSTVELVVSAGNIRETIKVRITRMYSVSFVLNGGEMEYDSTAYKVVEGSQIDEPPTPTKKDYVFKGWYTDSDFAEESKYTFGEQSIKNNLTLYAKWEKNDYTVTFISNGGSPIATLTNQKYDTFIQKPTDPTKEGYVFVGWGKENKEDALLFDFTGEKLQGNITLYAIWTEYPIVKITFDSMGGEPVDNRNVEKGENLGVNMPIPTRTGYTFLGWYQETSYQNKVLDTTTFSKNCILYAKWEKNTYIVVYNPNGGKGVSTSSTHIYDEYKALTANDFTREGYTFAGWNDDQSTTIKYTDKQSVKNLTAVADGKVQLYAVWMANEYTVIYNANGGKGSMKSSTHRYNSAAYLTANSFTCEGYKFMGWSDSSTSTIVKYTDGQSVKNLTTTANGKVNLYAIWQFVYTDTTRYTIGDMGYYGAYLGAGRRYEKLDLSAFAQYMNSDYTFKFTITVSVSEVSDGYQEVHLWNNVTYSTDSEISEATAKANGYITGSDDIEYGPGIDASAREHTITWDVSGENFQEIMYIRYDAQGVKNDDWHRNSIYIVIDVVEK